MSRETSLTPQPPLPPDRRGGGAPATSNWALERKRRASAAKVLRQRETPAESALWDMLRGRKIEGLKFRRQHPIGGWILDFACIEHKIGIEVDGSIHDGQEEDDARRTQSLSEYGYYIVRFSNERVLEDPDFVITRILETIELQTSTICQESINGSTEVLPRSSDLSPSPAERERGPGGEGRPVVNTLGQDRP